MNAGKFGVGELQNSQSPALLRLSELLAAVDKQGTREIWQKLNATSYFTLIYILKKSVKTTIIGIVDDKKGKKYLYEDNSVPCVIHSVNTEYSVKKYTILAQEINTFIFAQDLIT